MHSIALCKAFLMMCFDPCSETVQFDVPKASMINNSLGSILVFR